MIHLRAGVYGLVAALLTLAVCFALGVDPDVARTASMVVAAIVFFPLVASGEAKKKKEKETELAEESAAARRSLSELEPLESPCKITITRLSRFSGALNKAAVFLNGTSVGVLKNGETLDLTTSYPVNELRVSATDAPTRVLRFTAESDGRVTISFKLGGDPKVT